MIEIIDPDLLTIAVGPDEDPFELVERCREATGEPAGLIALGETTRDLVVEPARRSKNVIDLMSSDRSLTARHRLLLTPSICVRISAGSGRRGEIAPFPLPMLHDLVARLARWQPRADGASLATVSLAGPVPRFDAGLASSVDSIVADVSGAAPADEGSSQVIGLRRRSLDTGRDEQVLLLGTGRGWRLEERGSLRGLATLPAWRRFVTPLDSARAH